MKENKQTYTYLKDHGNDVSYENEVTYTVDPKLDLSEFRGPNDLEKQIENLKKQLQETQGELSIIKGINSNSPEVKELKKQLANAKIIDSVHQKLNGTLQKRVTELEIDNKKLATEVSDLTERLRKCE